MITNFKIFELFDFDYDINVIIEDKDEFKCSFSINGEEYFFHARDENKMYPDFIKYGWHLSFGTLGPDKYKLTGKNIPFKVLSGVKRCYEMFIKKYDPNRMSFIAEGEKKATLYLSMFGKEYKVTKRESGLESYSGDTPYLFMLDKI
jgi:hypothetical protein